MPAISGQSPLLSLNSMVDVCRQRMIPAFRPVRGHGLGAPARPTGSVMLRHFIG